jgi:hypothetical protein
MDTQPLNVTLGDSLVSSLMSQGYSSRLLRESVDDEVSRELREEMAALSRQIEAVLPLMTVQGWDAVAAGACIEQLQDVLRAHGPQVAELGPDWQRLPEHRSYLSSLHQLQAATVPCGLVVQTGQLPALELVQRFELAAWRAMGDGLLLVDLHDGTALGDLASAGPAPRWWQRIQSWLIGAKNFLP